MKEILIDLSSGDKGIDVIFKPLTKFLKENPNIKVVGFVTKIDSKKFDLSGFNNLKLIECDDIIGQDSSIREIIKKKNSSTLGVMLSYLVKNNSGIALSACNSGSLVIGSTLFSKPIKKDIKPAFAPFVKFDGRLRILLDAGANIDSTPEHLNIYATLGYIYSNQINNLGRKPNIGLINVGSEKNKGNDYLKKTYNLLAANKKISFSGNVEAHDLFFKSDVDVFLTNGLIGNMILKSYEGSFIYSSRVIRDIMKTNWKTKMGYFFLRKELKKKLSEAYQEEYKGGALILGLNHPILKIHGGANSLQFLNALNLSKTIIEKDIQKIIKRQLNK